MVAWSRPRSCWDRTIHPLTLHPASIGKNGRAKGEIQEKPLGWLGCREYCVYIYFFCINIYIYSVINYTIDLNWYNWYKERFGSGFSPVTSYLGRLWNSWNNTFQTTRFLVAMRVAMGVLAGWFLEMTSSNPWKTGPGVDILVLMRPCKFKGQRISLLPDSEDTELETRISTQTDPYVDHLCQATKKNWM